MEINGKFWEILGNLLSEGYPELVVNNYLIPWRNDPSPKFNVLLQQQFTERFAADSVFISHLLPRLYTSMIFHSELY
jgi:hypothetical protein